MILYSFYIFHYNRALAQNYFSIFYELKRVSRMLYIFFLLGIVIYGVAS